MLTICCSRCGSKKFYFTRSHTQREEIASHHGARCAICSKPLDRKDIIFPPLFNPQSVEQHTR